MLETAAKIKITEMMKESARSETMEDLRNLSDKLKDNFTFNRKFIGAIGQKCVEVFFRRNNISFETDHNRRPGTPDEFDIKSGSFPIDVKTRSYSQDNVMIIPKHQIDRKVFDYYIGVKLDGSLNFAFIHGYAFSGEIRTSILKQGKYGYWYHFPFERLNPVQNLIVNLPKAI